MTEIRPVSTDDDYKIACYFHDKLTELYSHWKIKFHHDYDLIQTLFTYQVHYILMTWLYDVTLELRDNRQFYLGIAVGWISCCITFILLVLSIKLGVGTL